MRPNVGTSIQAPPLDRGERILQSVELHLARIALNVDKVLLAIDPASSPAIFRRELVLGASTISLVSGSDNSPFAVKAEIVSGRTTGRLRRWMLRKEFAGNHRSRSDNQIERHRIYVLRVKSAEDLFEGGIGIPNARLGGGERHCGALHKQHA